MSKIILGTYVVFVVVVLIWGVQAIIRIHNYYKRRQKALDEWYQQEMKWLEKQEQEHETSE